MIRLLKRLWSLFWKTSKGKQQKPNVSDYPQSFYRGVQCETDIDENNYLKASAFLFGSQIRDDDGMSELSINWNDCDEALTILLNQKNKKGTDFMFKPGYASIQLSRFTTTVINQLKDGYVSYERRPIPEDRNNGLKANPYHGNILIHKSASDQMKKNIQHTLASIAVFTRRTG